MLPEIPEKDENMNNILFPYSKHIKLQKYELTKEELISFFTFLFKENTQGSFKLDNEGFNFKTKNVEEYLEVLSNSKSLITTKFELVNDNAIVEFNYNSLVFIKNNCTIKIYTKGNEQLELLEAVILNELKKYKNEVRILIYKISSILISILIFISMFTNFFDLKQFNNDFEVKISSLADIFIVSFIPTFFGLAVFNIAVPKFRLKNNDKF